MGNNVKGRRPGDVIGRKDNEWRKALVRFISE